VKPGRATTFGAARRRHSASGAYISSNNAEIWLQAEDHLNPNHFLRTNLFRRDVSSAGEETRLVIRLFDTGTEF
jgi:hypothetical protein